MSPHPTDHDRPRRDRLRVVPVAGRDSMLLNLSGAHGPFFTRNLVIADRQRRPHRRRRGAGRREDPRRRSRTPRALVVGQPVGDLQQPAQRGARALRRPRRRRPRAADLRPAHHHPRRDARSSRRCSTCSASTSACRSRRCSAKASSAMRSRCSATCSTSATAAQTDLPYAERAGRRRRLVAPAPRAGADARSGRAPGRGGARALRLQRLQAEGRRARRRGRGRGRHGAARALPRRPRHARPERRLAAEGRGPPAARPARRASPTPRTRAAPKTASRAAR